MKLFPAGAPELVRSNQKDRFYTEYITSLLSDISRQALPLRLWLKWQRELQLLAELGYHGFTTMLGNQTLGEEYCNLIQVGPPLGGRLVAPGFLRRITPVAIQIVCVYALERSFETLYRKIRERSLGSVQISESDYEFLERIVGCVEEVYTSASRIHSALFYIYGIFYHFGKRLAGIKYVMVRYENAMANQQSGSTYRMLGWLIGIQFAIKLMKWLYKRFRKKERGIQSQKENEDSLEVTDRESGMKISLESSAANKDSGTQLKCPLCLEICANKTATTCGHIFCWTCICDWTSEKAECPVCRTSVNPQQLIYLQHF